MPAGPVTVSCEGAETVPAMSKERTDMRELMPLKAMLPCPSASQAERVSTPVPWTEIELPVSSASRQPLPVVAAPPGKTTECTLIMVLLEKPTKVPRKEACGRAMTTSMALATAIKLPYFGGELTHTVVAVALLHRLLVAKSPPHPFCEATASASAAKPAELPATTALPAERAAASAAACIERLTVYQWPNSTPSPAMPSSTAARIAVIAAMAPPVELRNWASMVGWLRLLGPWRSHGIVVRRERRAALAMRRVGAVGAVAPERVVDPLAVGLEPSRVEVRLGIDQLCRDVGPYRIAEIR